MTTSPESRGPLSFLLADVRRYARFFGSDFRDGLHPQVLASIVFLFFACLAPAVAFGGLMSVVTDGAIGVVEMIVATSLCGIAYALLAGQPLTILGGTGPLLVFTEILYLLCQRLGVPFLSAYAWIGLWTAGFLVLLSIFGASRWIRLFTRFTDETFAALISVIFIVEAVSNILRAFPDQRTPDESALLSMSLALGTLYVSTVLARLRRSPYLREWLRNALADFSPAIAIGLMLLARWMVPAVQLPSLAIPTQLATTTGRPWLLPLLSGPSWLPVAAAIPAALVTVLVYLDQNITARLVSSPEHKLQKGPAYDLDLLIVGALIGLCSIFGLPWLVGATVRSLNHVRSLATVEISAEGTVAIQGVRENRVSALCVHLLIGASLVVAASLLRQVPMAILFGLFLYMGIASTRNNQLFERLRLWFMDPARYPPTYYLRRVPLPIVHRFTLVQLGCLVMLWIVKTSRAGILFPLFIALLVPVRRLLDRVLPPEHTATLDQEESDAEVEDRAVE